MAKYGKSASKNVESAMRRKKKGTLKSGSGRKVTSRKQAIAIGLSEAREKGAKVPPRKSSRKSSRQDVRRRARRRDSRWPPVEAPHPLRRRGAGSHRAGGRAAGVRPCQTEFAPRRAGQRRPRQAQGALEEIPARRHVLVRRIRRVPRAGGRRLHRPAQLAARRVHGSRSQGGRARAVRETDGGHRRRMSADDRRLPTSTASS